jgi:hypothetical protein
MYAAAGVARSEFYYGSLTMEFNEDQEYVEHLRALRGSLKDADTRLFREAEFDHVSISYNAEDDYLEVRFCDAEGYVVPTSHSHVDESIDPNGQMLGFWIRNVSKLLHAEPINLLLDARKRKEAAYRVEEIRKDHPNAYAKWTSEEDNLLMSRFKMGTDIHDLATIHHRKVGAIRSRLQKLGLMRP